MTATRRVTTAAQLERVGVDHGVVLELAGKWRHGYIPLDAVAMAIKAKQMKGDGKRRPGTHGKSRLDPAAAAQAHNDAAGTRDKGLNARDAAVENARRVREQFAQQAKAKEPARTDATPAKRKPSKVHEEYRRLRAEQDARFEASRNGGVAGRKGKKGGHTEEEQAYFGEGENMGRGGTEERLTYRRFLEGRRQSDDEKAHQAAYDAGVKLGARHAMRGTQPSDSEYDAAVNSHQEPHRDSFDGGFGDGVIAGGKKRDDLVAKRQTADQARKADPTRMKAGEINPSHVHAAGDLPSATPTDDLAGKRTERANRTPREIAEVLATDPSKVSMDELQRLSQLGGRFAPAANREIGRRDDVQTKAEGRDVLAEHGALDKAKQSATKVDAPATGDTAKAEPRIRIEHNGDGTTVHGTTREDAAKLKEQGFKWSGKQGMWYLPRTWGESTRSQRADALSRSLGADAHVVKGDLARSGTGEERAQARIDRAGQLAEHNAARAERKATEADVRLGKAKAIGDMIPMGQPILVGHHSEARHRRDLAKIDSNMRAGFQAQTESENLQQRSESAAARARLEEDPRFAARRAERNRAELGRVERSLATANPADEHTRRLQAMRTNLQQDIARDQAVVDANGNGLGAHNVQPGDLVQYRGDWHVAAKANSKTVAVPHWSQNLAAAGYTDKVSWSQLTGHKSIESASVESLQALLNRPGTSAQVKTRIQRILQERGQS